MINNHVDKQHQKVIALLKEVRINQGLSHEKLAQIAGIHRTAVGHIESGIRKPTLYNCMRIATALNIKLSEIMREAEKV